MCFSVLTLFQDVHLADVHVINDAGKGKKQFNVVNIMIHG